MAADSSFPAVDVDVVMVTYETAEVSAAAVRQLVESDQGVRIRLLVRDNASTDGTADAVEAVLRSSAVPFLLVRGEGNIGFGRAVNELIRAGDAPYVFLLNGDAWPADRTLDGLIRALQRHPRAAAVAPALLDESGEPVCSTYPFLTPRVAFWWDGTGPSTARRAAELGLPQAWEPEPERRVDWCMAAALLVRRSDLDAIGLFDERLFLYGEDLDWCWRVRQAGRETWYVPEVRVHHLGNASAATRYRAEARRTAITANTYRVYGWHRGRMTVLLLRAAQLAGVAARLVPAVARRDRTAVESAAAIARRCLVRVPPQDGPPTDAYRADARSAPRTWSTTDLDRRSERRER